MTFAKYRVVSEDGIACGSKIIDLSTGEPLKNVTAISLRACADDIWRADVSFVGVAVDVAVLEDVFVRIPQLPWWRRLLNTISPAQAPV